MLRCDHVCPWHEKIDYLLSPREQRALTLKAQGDNRIMIARKMFIAPSTVKVHLERARRKLGAVNTVHAIAIATREGLI